MIEWIRGKALETVLGLNALQEGDELLIAAKPALANQTRNWPAGEERATTLRYEDGVLVAPCACGCASCFILGDPEDTVPYIDVVAWRRPVK